MAFLADTILPGSAGLHIGGALPEKDGQRRLRKSRSHGGFLAPLIHLVRDPVGTIGSAVGSYEPAETTNASVGSAADRRQVLYLRMRNAETYEEWKAAAEELDILEGNDIWKADDDSTEYNAALVAARLKDLDDARLSCDVKRMMFLVRTSLTRGLGGMGDLRLYKHSHIGTKTLIERYIDSAQKTLTALLDVSATQGDACPMEPRLLVEGLLATRQSFGRSALLLSGGGTFGMNHIGVVKSLWQRKFLPRIISGASAGSIVCAVVCSKTDSEIPEVLEEFCYGDLAVFEKEGEEDGLMTKAARFLKYGALFDISHLVRVMRNLLGDITFQEAYNRTRRILNITVSSASLYELPRLLNYVTAPNVMIWSAVCASCSVPFVFSAASLLAKDPKTGKEVPWNPTPNAGWIDGSVDNDLPMTRLAEMFNVNHFIVSQVNPHVVPFLVKDEEMIAAEAQQTSMFTVGPTWVHNMANLAKGEALHRLQVLSEFGIFPNYLTKARSILNQRYSGDITIFPSIAFSHFPKVLSNPTTEYMVQCMLNGERATWSKLSRIQNHVAIELALDETIRKFRTRVVFSPSQVDLRLNNFTRPLSQGNPRPSSRPIPKVTRFERDTAPNTPSAGFSAPHRSLRVKVPPQPRVSKPYLPLHPLRKLSTSLDSSQDRGSNMDLLSSSTNADESSSDDEGSLDTDNSDILSSPSPPNSVASPIPLWPSTRQLFPSSSSQPSTPSLSATVFGRHSSSVNLAMTSDPNANPSSPELRYRRLFHPSSTNNSETVLVQPSTQTDVKGAIQPLNDYPKPLTRVQTLPEAQKFVPPGFHHTDSNAETRRAVDVTPLSSPQLPRSDTKPYANAKSKRAIRPGRPAHEIEPERERPRIRRGQSLGLLLDVSGTRGMMLRRKKTGSEKNGEEGMR